MPGIFDRTASIRNPDYQDGNEPYCTLLEENRNLPEEIHTSGTCRSNYHATFRA